MWYFQSARVDVVNKERIRNQIRKILMDEWDPIGVNDTPEAADEYDFYIGGVYRLLEQGTSEAEIVTHLEGIEVGRMGMINETGAPLMPEAKRRAAVSSLIALRGSFTQPS